MKPASCAFVLLGGLIGCLTAGSRPGRAQRAPSAAVEDFDVAPGLGVTLFAAEPDLVNPTSIDVDPRGRVWVAEAANYRIWKNPTPHPDGDRIRVLEDTDGDGRCDRAWTYYQDRSLQAPLGIAVVGARVYVCQSPDLFYLEDTDGDGRADRRTVILTGFGGIDNDHGLHGVMIGPDGLLYMSNGDQGLDVTDGEGRRAWVGRNAPFPAGSVLRTDLDGRRLDLLAWNFRNPYEPAVDPFGEVFISDNDDDGNEQTRLLHVLEGGDYGYWPRREGDRRRDEVHWNEDRPGVIPKILRTGFGSPTGMAFYWGSLLPERIRGALLHADAGPRLLRAYHLSPEGASYHVEPEVLLAAREDTWFRPTDVAVAPDGSVLVADWYDPGVGGHDIGDFTRGRIYRLAPPGAPYRSLALDPTSIEGAFRAFRSPNAAAHHQGAEALAVLADPEVDARLEKLLAAADPLMRARAAWLAWRRPSMRERAAAAMLGDPDARLRTLAVRLLTPSGPEGVERALKLLEDADPRPRRQLLLALAGSSEARGKRATLELTAQWDGQDPFYRLAAGIALKGRAAEAFAQLADRWGRRWDARTAGLAFELHPPAALAWAREILASSDRPTEERRTAIRVLGAVPSETSAGALIGVLAGPAPEELTTAALAELARDRGRPWGAALDDPKLERALRAAFETESLRSGAIGFIRETRRVAFAATLMEVARDPASDLSVRREALESAGTLVAAPGLDPTASSALIEALEATVRERPPALSRVALEALGRLRGEAGQHALRRVMLDQYNDREIQIEAAHLLAASRPGALLLLSMIEENEMRPSILFDVMPALYRSPHEEIRTMAEQLVPRPRTGEGAALPEKAAFVDLAGDPVRGREVFFRSEGAQCARCHRIDGDGGEIGPELTRIGAKLGLDGLFDSIVNPSAAIAPEYEVWVFRARGQGYLSGYLRRQSEEEVEIVEATGAMIKLKSEEVLERRKSAVSLMPTGLTEAINVQELADLVAFLATLK